MLSQKNRMVGAILLVSGTTIGAAMLALPATMGLAGFLPSLFVMGGIWLLMLITALYILEVNLRMPNESNLISMAKKTLGKGGEIATWILNLLLLYALTAAYLIGCSQIVDGLLQQLGWKIPFWVFPAALSFLFGIFNFLGTSSTDGLNRLMMVGLGISYFFLIGTGCCYIQSSFLLHSNFQFLLPSISVVITAFGYHVIIPTLSTYLNHDKKSLIQAIVIGSFIPFFVYLIWQLFVMGIIPVSGTYSLTSAAHEEMPITFYLQMFLKSKWIGTSGHAFAFFAIVTSLLGVALSLSDFLADGFKIKKNIKGKILLVLLTFIPPLLFGLFYPKGFVLALKYAGILVVLLLVLLPALMVWKQRGKKSRKGDFEVVGGRALIILIIILGIALLGVEISQL